MFLIRFGRSAKKKDIYEFFPGAGFIIFWEVEKLFFNFSLKKDFKKEIFKLFY